MISNTILFALNDQIVAELGASNQYLQMSIWFDSHNYQGFAKYLRKQSDDERCHAIKFIDYILDQSAHAIIKEIEAPKNDWQSCEEIFSAILELEKKVTSLITNIYKIAALEGDYATIIFLQWFVDEQVKSVRESSFNLGKISAVGSDVAALFEFDEYLGEKNE
jgi:ferritin